MLTRNRGTFLTLGIILMIVCGSVYAQQKVYKWVDEDGVVHYGEEPPGESTEAKVEVFTTDPAPAYVPPAQTTIKSTSTSETNLQKQPTQRESPTRPQAKEIDIREMSLADLDRRCEDAREEKIAPLKASEIEKCIETGTGDRAWCETFWADYGNAGRTKTGVFIPRQFDDLPECVEAWEERNRRGLYPGGDP
jgi:hypothetical protein